MSINHLYHTSLQQLRQLRPRERITRVRTVAALMAGIMQSKSVHLSHIALKIPGPAKELSVVRRLERLLENRALRVREWYRPIALSWLASSGTKTGAGFFSYTPEERERLFADRDRRYAALSELLEQLP
jgi:hypothetical protein